MKKITLLLATVVASFTMNAQIIYEQPADATSGIISGFFNNHTAGASGVYSAADFTLTSSADVYHIKAPGFQGGNATLDINTITTDFSLYIFLDNSGTPLGDPSNAANAIVNLPNIAMSNVTIEEDGIFTIDVAAANGGNPVNLPAGTYWISAVPSLDLDTHASPDRWNWFGSTTQVDGEAMLIDPSNHFAAGATSWTPFSVLGLTFTELGFTLYDQNLVAIASTSLSTEVSVYPNPVNDVLNINVPASLEIESATLVNILGQSTPVSISNNSINTANLNSGVYLLNITTNEGTITKKIVKN